MWGWMGGRKQKRSMMADFSTEKNANYRTMEKHLLILQNT